jgi:hypothetical protein
MKTDKLPTIEDEKLEGVAGGGTVQNYLDMLKDIVGAVETFAKKQKSAFDHKIATSMVFKKPSE